MGVGHDGAARGSFPPSACGYRSRSSIWGHFRYSLAAFPSQCGGSRLGSPDCKAEEESSYLCPLIAILAQVPSLFGSDPQSSHRLHSRSPSVPGSPLLPLGRFKISSFLAVLWRSLNNFILTEVLGESKRLRLRNHYGKQCQRDSEQNETNPISSSLQQQVAEQVGRDRVDEAFREETHKPGHQDNTRIHPYIVHL